MTRDEKAAAVAALNDRFKQATVALVATSQGLSVGKMQALRRALKQVDGEYKVAKNTLARRALPNTAYQKLEALLDGPTGIVFGYSDPVAVAKVLVRFAQDNDKLAVKAGMVGEQLLEAKGVGELAILPPRDVLLAKLLGVLQAPAAQLLRTINEPGARVARLLDRVRAQRDSNE